MSYNKCVKSEHPGLVGTVAVFTGRSGDGPLTKVTGTNVTCAQVSSVYTFTFTDINIYNSERPVCLPFVQLGTGASYSAHDGAITITAASNTVTVVVRVYDDSGSLAAITASDSICLVMFFRRSAS